MSQQKRYIRGLAFARWAAAGAITRAPGRAKKMPSFFVWNFRYTRVETLRNSTRIALLWSQGETVTRIEKLCVDKGLRMTEQRRVIARVLSDAADHPDAEELYRRASALDPHISIATVYRTVKLFEDAGILERHDFRDGRSRYEEMPESHHDHLIDVQSGRVIEFHNEEIEKLQRRMAEELGFELVDHRLELYGVPKKSR